MKLKLEIDYAKNGRFFKTGREEIDEVDVLRWIKKTEEDPLDVFELKATRVEIEVIEE